MVEMRRSEKNPILIPIADIFGKQTAHSMVVQSEMGVIFTCLPAFLPANDRLL